MVVMIMVVAVVVSGGGGGIENDGGVGYGDKGDVIFKN